MKCYSNLILLSFPLNRKTFRREIAMPGKTNIFHKYLFADSIRCNMTADSSTEVLQALLCILKHRVPAMDIDKATHEVLAREKIFPTIITEGLAVPHARLTEISEPLVAMAILPAGVPFDPQGTRVKVVILLLTPMAEPNLHIQLMSGLANTFLDAGSVERLAAQTTPAAVLQFFRGNQVELSSHLTAADMMRPPAHVLKETDSVQQAIAKLTTSRSEELPVLDKDGDLRGVFGLNELLKFTLPEHLLWMEDLSPIDRFQPFADLLKSASDTKVADLMREEYLAVPQNLPAIQLAKLFIVHSVRQMIVINETGKLAGIVELKDFCGKLFWD